MKLLATLPKLDVSRFETLTIREWLDRELSGSLARELVEALLRLSTYANAPDIAGVRSALAQLQLGVHGAVLYLDGGWRTIVTGLGAAARNAGAHVETSCTVAALEEDGVLLADGRKLKASAIVLAVAPFEVARLTGHVTKLEPIRAACLDVALSRLPDPATNFALGIDEPLYLSVHSSVAKLAPAGGALIHVARYLAPGETSDAECLEALESISFAFLLALEALTTQERGVLVLRDVYDYSIAETAEALDLSEPNVCRFSTSGYGRRYSSSRPDCSET